MKIHDDNRIGAIEVMLAAGWLAMMVATAIGIVVSACGERADSRPRHARRHVRRVPDSRLRRRHLAPHLRRRHRAMASDIDDLRRAFRSMTPRDFRAVKEPGQ